MLEVLWVFLKYFKAKVACIPAVVKYTSKEMQSNCVLIHGSLCLSKAYDLSLS